MDSAVKSVHSIAKDDSPAAKQISQWKGLIKKHDKCRLPIKKYKVVKRSDVDIILHRVNSKSYIHYLTEGKVKQNKFSDDKFVKANLNKEEDINIYKLEQSKLGCVLPDAFLLPETHGLLLSNARKVDNEMNRSVTLDVNLRDRVYVEEKLIDSLKGITDVDEKYFSIVQKRRKKVNMKMQNYLNYLRESLRLRLQTGYVFDEILKLEEQEEIEQNQLKQIQAKLKDYSTSFNEFLAEDHNESMKPLLTFAEEVAETDKRRHILKEKMLAVTTTRFDIYDLEETWRKSKLCEEFLLTFLSILSGNPSSYYLELKYGSERSSSNDDQLVESDSMLSLLQFTSPKIIDENLEINLKEPASLLEIFTSLEHQCLDYLTLTELLEKPNNLLSTHIDLISDLYNYEIRSISQVILKLTNVISFIEDKNKALEAHVNNLINGLFKETFAGAEESIIINEYIRQTYRSCVTTSEISATSTQMMNALTSTYTKTLLEMDILPTDLLRKFVREVEQRETKRLCLARNARRKLHEYQILTEQMLRLFKPILLRKSRPLMFRSLPPIRKERPPPEPQEITQEEKEYLYLFTDFCPYSDDANVYLSKRDKTKGSMF